MSPVASTCQLCGVRQACFIRCVLAQQAQPLPVEVRRYPRGAWVSSEGVLSTAAKTVRSGSLIAYRRGLDGQQRPVALLTAGTPIGPGAPLGLAHQMSTRAARPVTTCEVATTALRAAVQADPALDRHVRSVFIAGMEPLSHWSQVVRVRGLVPQIAYSLLLMSDLQGGSELDVPSYTAWAALLGLRREALVRGLGTLLASGSVQLTERRRCVIQRNLLLERLHEAGPQPALAA